MKTEQTTTNFLMINYDLLSSKKFTSSTKLLIAYILGWQASDKICFESNAEIGAKLGLKKTGIKSITQELNKYDFFSCITNGTSNHELRINEALLAKFLNDSIEQPIEKQPKGTLPKIVDEETHQPVPVIEDIFNQPDTTLKDYLAEHGKHLSYVKQALIGVSIQHGEITTLQELHDKLC